MKLQRFIILFLLLLGSSILTRPFSIGGDFPMKLAIYSVITLILVGFIEYLIRATQEIESHNKGLDVANKIAALKSELHQKEDTLRVITLQNSRLQGELKGLNNLWSSTIEKKHQIEKQLVEATATSEQYKKELVMLNNRYKALLRNIQDFPKTDVADSFEEHSIYKQELARVIEL